MMKKKAIREGVAYIWTPSKDRLLKRLYCVDRFHVCIILNNLQCTHAVLYKRIKDLKLNRKRKPSKASKEFSFTYKPKLDLEKAREIRELFANGKRRKEIAYKYGVHVATVNYVVNNKIWKEKEDA